MKCLTCGGKNFSELIENGNKYFQCIFCQQTYTQEELEGNNYKASSDIGSKLYEKVINSVAELECKQCRGSGFLIDKAKGYLLTNAHCVVKNGKLFNNLTATIAGETVSAEVIAYDEHDYDKNKKVGIDLALLKLDYVPKNAIDVQFEDYDKVKTGEQCFAIGNSLGEKNCIVGGIVSDKKRDVGGRVCMMTDCQINNGNSGGPAFNKDGKVIGIITSARQDASGTRDVNGMKYAIPSFIAEKFIRNYSKYIH